MSTIGHSSWTTARRSASGLLLAVLLLAAVAGPAGARTSVPGDAGTNLSIGAETARLVGSEALIRVECEGPGDGLCSGTLTVSAGGESRKAPYSVFAGSRQSLAVSVGPGFAGSGDTAVAVARTAQSAGGYVQSRAVVHFR